MLQVGHHLLPRDIFAQKKNSIISSQYTFIHLSNIIREIREKLSNEE